MKISFDGCYPSYLKYYDLSKEEVLVIKNLLDLLGDMTTGDYFYDRWSTNGYFYMLKREHKKLFPHLSELTAVEYNVTNV